MSGSHSDNEDWATPPPPPRFQWMRPRMQGYPDNVILYTRDRVLRDIPDVLRNVWGQLFLDRFLEGPFRYIRELRRKDVAISALHELLAWELTDSSIPEHERWFSIGGREIVCSPREWAIVTGLRFGPSAFNPYGRNHIIPLSSLHHTKFGSAKAKIKANRLRDDFFDERSLGTPEQYLKAANLELKSKDLANCGISSNQIKELVEQA